LAVVVLDDRCTYLPLAKLKRPPDGRLHLRARLCCLREHLHGSPDLLLGLC
jgi:hypothetical protein